MKLDNFSQFFSHKPANLWTYKLNMVFYQTSFRFLDLNAFGNENLSFLNNGVSLKKDAPP